MRSYSGDTVAIIEFRRFLIIFGIPILIAVLFTIGYRISYSTKDLTNFILTSDKAEQFRIADYNGDGIDDILLLQLNDEEQQYFKVADMELNPLQHTPLLNSKQHLGWTDDINDDGKSELLLVRNDCDPISCNIYSNNNNSLEIDKMLKFPHPQNGRKDWKDDITLSYIDVLDINNDDNNEILFQLHANHEYQPRSLIAYDLKRDTIVWQYKYGAAMTDFILGDFNGDSDIEILMGSKAHGNGGGRKVNGTSDNNSYITILDKHGKVVWQKIVGGLYSWCCTNGHDWINDTIPNIYASVWPTHPQDLSDSDDPTYLTGRLVAFNGKTFACLDQIILGNGISSKQEIVPKPHNLGDDILLITSSEDCRIRLYDSHLREKAVSKFYIESEIKKFKDIDGDGIDEIFVISNNQELIILNRYLHELYKYSSGKLTMADVAIDSVQNIKRFVICAEGVIVSEIPSPPPLRLAGIYHWLMTSNIPIGYLALFGIILAISLWRKFIWSSLAVEASEFSIQSGSGLIALDNNNRIIYANRKSREMLDFPTKWRFRKLSNLLPEEHTHNLSEFITEIKENSRSQKSLDLPFRVDGRLQPYEFKHLKTKPGKFRNIIILSIHDPRPKSMGDLVMDWYGWATDVAHQMKNTIAVVMHSIGLAQHSLQDSNRNDTELESDLVQSMQLLARSSELSRRIMQFHIREPDFDYYPLKILLQNAIDATILNARFDCEFILDVNPPDYKAYTDEKLFVELISYLIQNSLESIDHENGRIQIRAKLVSKLHTEIAGETYNIRIIDNGCGISEKNMNKIYKLHFTTKAEKGGTGLGVPRVVQICEVLNGELFYNSTEGQGTEAILNFRKMNEGSNCE
jgi:hypothetical protein